MQSRPGEPCVLSDFTLACHTEQMGHSLPVTDTACSDKIQNANFFWFAAHLPDSLKYKIDINLPAFQYTNVPALTCLLPFNTLLNFLD